MAKQKHAHHGGSWKVAYADFVTAMMALFLCLWLTAQDTKIKDAVERAFRNPFSSVTKESTGIIPNKEASASYKQAGKFDSVSAVEMETMRHVSDDLTKLLQKQDETETGVQIDLTSDGLRINIFDRSNRPIFEAGNDTFTPYGAWVFSTLAWEISRYKTFKIELEGHTETNVETGHEAHGKWDLSTERANAARRKVVQSGVDDLQICKVSGFADTAPMPAFPPEAEINRRVTVLLKLKASIDGMSTTTASTAPDDNTHAN
ncbi:MAG TPA: flagellar motor protein MotB [Verrucomicrobiae bacterium]|jgi:chemotaxis protein MotB|nr:flagellar motor protein MotB [Verrucomicrobiae bacterium]